MSETTGEREIERGGDRQSGRDRQTEKREGYREDVLKLDTT